MAQAGRWFPMHAVRSTVANPAFSAPLSSSVESCSHCVASNRQALRRALALSFPNTPLTPLSCRAYTLTVRRNTPSRRAT